MSQAAAGGGSFASWTNRSRAVGLALMVGKHRRIPGAALVEYRKKMFHQAQKASAAMAQQGQKLGLYDLEGPSPKAP